PPQGYGTRPAAGSSGHRHRFWSDIGGRSDVSFLAAEHLPMGAAGHDTEGTVYPWRSRGTGPILYCRFPPPSRTGDPSGSWKIVMTTHASASVARTDRRWILPVVIFA